MAHAHHHHPPGHDHAPRDFGRAFVVGMALNLGFVAVETVYGVLAGSMALLADAGHNFGDVLGLLVAWVATLLARRGRSERFTYGLRSSSILAALANAVLLLVAVGGIGWEAVRRFAEPAPVAGATVMAVGAIGMLVNGATAWLFAAGRRRDINIRGAFLHMAADAAVSLGVVAAGGLVLWTGQSWIDPVTSLVIAAVIVWGTWDLLRQALTLSLQGVPAGIELAEVRAVLERLPGVACVHHLHVWAVSTTEAALTGHLVMRRGHPGDAFLAFAARELRDHCGIGHATLQIEVDGGSRLPAEGTCPLDEGTGAGTQHVGHA